MYLLSHNMWDRASPNYLFIKLPIFSKLSEHSHSLLTELHNVSSLEAIIFVFLLHGEIATNS